MSYADHDHRGDYADQRHDHDGDYAGLHHRHFDLEREDDRLQAVLREMDTRLGELRSNLEAALGRIRELEQQTPQARRLQYEADLAAADLAESGYCECGSPNCARCRTCGQCVASACECPVEVQLADGGTLTLDGAS